MSEWREGSLTEIADIIMGQSPKGEFCSSERDGTPLLNGPTEFGIKFPTPIQYTTQVKKVSNINDILFCVRGSTTGRMNWANIEYAIGRGLASIRHKHGEEYRYFIKAVLDFNLPILLSSATGSTFPNVSRSQLEELRILLPSLEEQKAIAEILSLLDDKINLLHHQNKTLEELAQTVFRQWFIEEAKDNWEKYKIRDFTTHKKDSIKPAQNPNDEFLHFSLPAFDANKEPNITIGSDIKSNKYQVEPFSILMSKLNPKTPRVWDIYFEPKENSICSTEFQVVQPNDKSLFPFISTLLKSDKVTGELSMSASGTSGSHQRVKPEDIFNISFVTPSIDKMKEFSELLEPNYLKQIKNQNQIQTLENMRDTLLPKLMSGEIRINI